MIAEQIINLILALAENLYNLIVQLVPQAQVADKLVMFTTKILEISTQGPNFVRFMVGDYSVALIEIALMMLLYKYTLFPIIQFLR